MAQIGLLLNLNGRQIIRGIADSFVVDCLREGSGSLIVNKLWPFGLNLNSLRHPPSTLSVRAEWSGTFCFNIP